MKIKCEYCDRFIEDTDEICPYCGATNDHVIRKANGIPETIEQLKDYCEKNKLPLQQMRFFIGEDYKEPRAFGIYKDEKTGNFVVYKNKSDGSRAVRYQGKDESYAVNELYQKIQSEISQQKLYQAKQISRQQTGATNRPLNQQQMHRGAQGRQLRLPIQVVLLGGMMFVVMFISVALLSFTRFSDFPTSSGNGYYSYGNSLYYELGGNWYKYDSANDDWYGTSVPSELNSNMEQYEVDYDSNWGITDFESSEEYSNYASQYYDNQDYEGQDYDGQEYDKQRSYDFDDDDCSWDSFSDWGSSWDSDATDWGDDW